MGLTVVGVILGLLGAWAGVGLPAVEGERGGSRQRRSSTPTPVGPRSPQVLRFAHVREGKRLRIGAT